MAKKRANGEGSIRKRLDGRWEGRYTAGYDPETGKRITKNVLGKTQAEVKEKLAKAIEESKKLDIVRSDEYTVAEWLRLWYELYARPNIRPTTADSYHCGIESHVIPRIGSIKLKKLTSRDIQKMYKDLQENGCDTNGLLFFVADIQQLHQAPRDRFGIDAIQHICAFFRVPLFPKIRGSEPQIMGAKIICEN